ncbi:DUF6048 family protein [Luteirhabdus pelagi]|uniref:DUF6048 family protein n=1 Tax=Luteirhabdus pelagi TaxID=2792783 RepID=UPI0019395F17|nr:DUF6048 family protein [Luteirhabdus pelagi]
MKLKPILLFCISLLGCSAFLVAQETATSSVTDTVVAKDKYGLRAGIDLAKLARTAFEEDYTGFEIVGDFRISKYFYVAAELGTEEKTIYNPTINYRSQGSYARVGVDYNAYMNWLDMNNAIYGGLRYGFSTFSEDLLAYQVYTTNQTFPPVFKTDPIEYSGLSAHWAEIVVGIKTELFNNLYLSLNLQLKRMITETTPDNFDNLYVPGFNKTNDFSEFGVGYGYTLSYLIPIFKKDR